MACAITMAIAAAKSGMGVCESVKLAMLVQAVPDVGGIAVVEAAFDEAPHEVAEQARRRGVGQVEVKKIAHRFSPMIERGQPQSAAGSSFRLSWASWQDSASQKRKGSSICLATLKWLMTYRSCGVKCC